MYRARILFLASMLLSMLYSGSAGAVCLLTGTSPWFIAKVDLAFDKPIPGVSFSRNRFPDRSTYSPDNSIFSPAIVNDEHEPIYVLAPANVYSENSSSEWPDWQNWLRFIQGEIARGGRSVYEQDLNKRGVFESDESLNFVRGTLKARLVAKYVSGRMSFYRNYFEGASWSPLEPIGPIPLVTLGIRIEDEDNRPADVRLPPPIVGPVLVAVYQGNLYLLKRKVSFSLNKEYVDGAYAKAESVPCDDNIEVPTSMLLRALWKELVVLIAVAGLLIWGSWRLIRRLR